MNEQNNPILEVKNLRVSYHTYAGEVKAVRGVQFSLEKGQALAIVGESGCGKSVTAKSIMGLIKAPQGEIKENSEILYHGENILKYNKKQWQHYKGGECAIIFQDALASLNPTMRVGKQIMENLMGHKNMTKQERHLWYDYLRKSSPTWLRQRVIDQYIVDFYCSKAKLIIELDGSQHYTVEGEEYDSVRTEVLEQYGLEVIRFSNDEIDRHFDDSCRYIEEKIKERIGEYPVYR